MGKQAEYDVRQIMTVEEANAITGGLSWPSKMPCPSYGLPTSTCVTGSLLATLPGTICHACYASKGFYRFKNVQVAQLRRFKSLKNPNWVEAMAHLINNFCKNGHFRWHDSGDIQSVGHLERIYSVCFWTPTVEHWLLFWPGCLTIC